MRGQGERWGGRGEGWTLQVVANLTLVVSVGDQVTEKLLLSNTAATQLVPSTNSCFMTPRQYKHNTRLQQL